MKTQFGLVLFFGLNMLASPALATGGSEAGNGGSSIVCQDSEGHITSVELLDFYEGRAQRGIEVDLGLATDSVDVKLDLAVQRLKSLDQGLASRLEDEIVRFHYDSHFYSGIRLVEIPDSQNLFIPKGCQQEQIAVWREQAVPEDKRYNINGDLWNRLDNDHKAGLILHETLYYIASQNKGFAGTSDSRMIRYLVSKIASLDAYAWWLKDFVSVLRQLHFTSFFYQSLPYVIGDGVPYFTEADDFLGGPLESAQLIQIQGKPVFVTSLQKYQDDFLIVELLDTTRLSVDGQEVWFQKARSLQLDKNRILSGYAIANSKNVFSRPGSYELKIKSVEGRAVHLKFAPDGTLELCKACEGSVFIQGKSYPVGVPDPYNEQSIYESISYGSFGPQDLTFVLSSPAQFKVGSHNVLLEGQIRANPTTNSIREAQLAQNTVFQIGQKAISFGKGRVVFYNSGQVRFGILAQDSILDSVDGTNIMYWAGMSLEFSENGLVSNVQPRKTRKPRH